MRLIWPLLLFIVCTLSIVIVWNNSSSARKFVAQRLDSGDFLTFEVRYSPEEVLAMQRQIVGSGEGHSIQEPRLTFFPYLLLDVKYSRQGGSTGEGPIIWSLVNGEMVLSTETWALSHGFEDCINADATPNDYRLIQTLLAEKRPMDVGAIAKSLRLDEKITEQLLKSAVKKQLVVNQGDLYRLHFEDPYLPSVPQTKLEHWMVTKTYKHTVRVPASYTEQQITAAAQAAFGSHLAIRRVQQVYLPVYTVDVKNPDGSILTRHWNALNGKPIFFSSQGIR